MRSVDESARAEVLMHYSERLVVLLLARDAYRTAGKHVEATVCQGAVALLKKAYVMEQTNPEPRPFGLGFPGER